MKKKQAEPNDIDKYISEFPMETKRLLEQMRTLIRTVAPDAEECICYGMPAYKLKGMLVYFAGYGKHIGFYPTASGVREFKKDLSSYKTSKGAIQFPLVKSLPVQLITKIVTFRVKENLQKDKLKNLRVCPKGHKYFKSSDCPVCPICEKERKPKSGFLSLLSAPARRALESNNITSLKQLSKYTEKEILNFHGIGKSSIPKLHAALKAEGLKLKA